MRYLPKSDSERRQMLEACGVGSTEELFSHLPEIVRLNRPLDLPPGISEYEIVQYFRDRAAQTATGYASFLGAGVYNHYRPVLVDAVVSRGEFLTSYTPYQAEISQGTLTTIFEFQTMICQLTGMDVANASMYDGSTAVPEAAMMAVRATGKGRVLVARSVHPEYREVLRTFAKNQGMPVDEFGYVAETGSADLEDLERKIDDLIGAVIIQSPNFFGIIDQVKAAAEIAHRRGALLIVVFTEAVALGILEPPTDADIVAGELQSFAISPSYGGPYAGIIATKEKFIRQMPGRLVGETVDSHGNRAFCLTLSTREQHIRRERATSNICTNQALIALMATVFMTIYGKQGLRELAEQNLAKAHYLAGQVTPRFSGKFFNEFVARVGSPDEINKALLKKKIIGGLPLGRFYPELSDSMLLCATEMSKRADMDAAAQAIVDHAASSAPGPSGGARLITKVRSHLSQNELLVFERSSPGKKAYQLPELDVPPVDAAEALGSENVRPEIEGFPEISEVEAIRHFTRLSTWNYAIDYGMYPLGSCTMKYNPRINELVARTEGLAWAHPYQPEALSQGCMEVMARLEAGLAEITGMDAVTLQPGAGAQGELTGILLIRALLEKRGNPRKKILIPDSAHGTNPATAAIAGYAVENVKSSEIGLLDVAALEQLVNNDVAALMVTNPNTLGVFENNITQAADILHRKGAMLYMDGANMNALVGIARPGDFGVDVMHLNLHKTFSTPHGGGGPGAGPVAVKKVLEPFLPIPRLRRSGKKLAWDSKRKHSIGRVKAFYGNFGVLVRALAYILAHGGPGLRNATVDAVLNAVYIRKALEPYYDLPYQSPNMHEVVFSDDRQAKLGVRTGDLAKRLIDYGFHPYTVSFPLIVHGALMIEPTETESKHELDQFIEAMKSIAHEIETDPQLIKTAPHSTRTSRVDEVGAARKPVLRWKPE